LDNCKKTDKDFSISKQMQKCRFKLLIIIVTIVNDVGAGMQGMRPHPLTNILGNFGQNVGQFGQN